MPPEHKLQRAARFPTRIHTAPLPLCLGMVVPLLMLMTGCGYQVAGRGSRLPQGWTTIAVPTLENKTLRYRVEQRLTEAIIGEFLARAKYRIVSDPAQADAVVHGEVSGLESSAVLFDTATGRATTVLITVRLKVRLEEIGSGRIVWQNDNYVFREEYELSTDSQSFFDEQNPALDRLSRDFASAFVAMVLENF